MPLDYQQLAKKYGATSIKHLHSIFEKEIVFDWSDLYKEMSWRLFGYITSQNFHGFNFIFDCTEIDPDPISTRLPDSRVVGVFGYSNTNVNLSNRKMMHKHLGQSTKVFSFFGDNYDKGHFIAHYSGGPIDINLFPQRRDINRGWSAEGKRYRAMEKFIAANPGTFVFSRPIYNDFSCCPYEIEYGYCDAEFNFTVEVFPNR